LYCLIPPACHLPTVPSLNAISFDNLTYRASSLHA
jgi:hypothetical protein